MMVNFSLQEMINVKFDLSSFEKNVKVSKDNDEDREKIIFSRRDKLDLGEKRISINQPKRSI